MCWNGARLEGNARSHDLSCGDNVLPKQRNPGPALLQSPRKDFPTISPLFHVMRADLGEFSPPPPIRDDAVDAEALGRQGSGFRWSASISSN